MAENKTKKKDSVVPDGVKKPQDRKKKIEQPEVKTVTLYGMNVTVDPDALDDFEMLDDIGELENGNAGRLPRILKRLVGDQYRPLLDAARDKDTRKVSIEAGGEMVEVLMGALDPNS